MNLIVRCIDHLGIKRVIIKVVRPFTHPHGAISPEKVTMPTCTYGGILQLNL